MKLINQSVEYLPQEEGLEGIYKQIERSARVCYKSEDKSTEDSKSFVAKLIKMKHFSMLEHSTVYLKVEGNTDFKTISSCIVFEVYSRYRYNPYSKIVTITEGKSDKVTYYITTNYRVIVENNWLDDLKYQCEPTEHHIKRYTFRLTTSIGIGRELTRHRAFSFAQESSRYCDYSNNSKFNEGITFIIPYWLKNSNDGAFKTFMDNCRSAETSYFKLKEDLSPQQAREVLPLCTKSELIMTGFEDDWKRFLDVRLEGTTGKPHPDMVELAKMIKDELEKAKK